MIIIGLTGSIGMGKSTAAGMLETLGIKVHESDAAVHDLLGPGGGAVEAVRKEFPKTYVSKNDEIDRAALGEIVFENEIEREKLEEILHPLVQQAQAEFIKSCRATGQELAVLDIPLLFETGAEARVDFVLVVSAPEFVQRARVMERPGMTEEKFAAIIARQMPDGEKCARADFIIHTGLGRAHTMKELKAALREIKSGKNKSA